MSSPPDILKYFHEEPALLEPVTPDADPARAPCPRQHDPPRHGRPANRRASGDYSSPPVRAERMTAAAGTERRRPAAAPRTLLQRVHVAFFPEPVHDGHDWSFFSAAPVRDRIVAALHDPPADDTRRFVLPYQNVRSESKFYFDTWQLTASSLPDYIEDV